MMPTARDATIWRMFHGGEPAPPLDMDLWDTPHASFGQVETYADKLAALGFEVEITRLPLGDKWKRIESMDREERTTIYSDWSVGVEHLGSDPDVEVYPDGREAVVAARGWAAGPTLTEAFARCLMDLAERLGIDEHEGSLLEALKA